MYAISRVNEGCDIKGILNRKCYIESFDPDLMEHYTESVNLCNQYTRFLASNGFDTEHDLVFCHIYNIEGEYPTSHMDMVCELRDADYEQPLIKITVNLYEV